MAGSKYEVRGFIVSSESSTCNIYENERLFCSLKRSYHRDLDADAEKLAQALNRNEIFGELVEALTQAAEYMEFWQIVKLKDKFGIDIHELNKKAKAL